MALKVTSNLIGGTELMASPSQKGSGWSCNCFPEHNGKNLFQASMYGLKYLSGLGVSGNIRGVFVPSVGRTVNNRRPDIYVVVEGSLLRVGPTGDVATVSTNIGTTTSRVGFAETGGERALLLLVDGVNMWYLDLLNGGSLQSITLPQRISGSGTIKPTHVAVVGGSIVVNDAGSGYLYYSIAYPLNNAMRKMFVVDPDTHQPTYNPGSIAPVVSDFPAAQHVFEDDYQVQQFFNGESSSDEVTAIYALGSALYVFGPKTVEIWQRGTGEYQTWQRTSYTINAANGIDAPYSVAHSNDTLFYLAAGEAYGKCCMAVTGTNFSKVSEDWLDEKLMASGLSNTYGFSYSTGGHTFYVLQLEGIGETWVYDSVEKTWHQRQSRNSAGTPCQWRVQGMAWANGRFNAFCADGGLYSHMADYFYEDWLDGSTVRSWGITRTRQTSVIVNDYRPFVFEELSIECNVGEWPENESPEIRLEVSRDGGNTFGNIRTASLGRGGDYSRRVRFLNLGMNRLCVIRVSMSWGYDFTMTASGLRVRPTGAMI